MRTFRAIVPAALGSILAFGLAQSASAQATELQLDRPQVENIVRRSYQYVALYNVINKTALAPTSNPMGTGGWNKERPDAN